MEPFPQNKAKGTKKVIVATKNTSNNILRARPTKGAASPRHHKNRSVKTFPSSLPANGSLVNLSWHNIRNGSPEKTPLGHNRSETNFETSCNGVRLNSSNFLSESKFNATLFSSAAGYSSHGLDDEEAMDIDHQDIDINDEAACAVATCDSASKLTEGISPACDQPRAPKHKIVTDDYTADEEKDKNVSSTKPVETKEESSVPVVNQAKETVTSAPDQKTTSTTSLPQKRRPIYIVLHVSTIKIGQLVGKASAPVKIYAEKVFIEMETTEGNGCNRASYHFRIPCKDLTECRVNFGGSPLLLAVKPSDAGASAIQEKCKERGKFLDPQSKDIKKRYIVLVMNYHVVPRDIKADLTELFQNRFADQLTWSELGSQEAQDILDKKDEPPSTVEASSAQSPKRVSPVSKEQRKILTPKGKGTRKKLFDEGSKSAPTKLSAASSSGTDECDLRCAEGKNVDKSNALDSVIQTRSRRRKASAFTESEKPALTGSETVKPDILLHHKKMESHISLLDQHSKEQRESLQQHQKLLEFERGKLREVEEEKERSLGRMRDLEISYSADKERLLERVRILETALHEKDQILTQQAVNRDLINNELEQERISVRQLQKELEQECEANSRMRKVQSDLVRVSRALDEETVLRNMREQQLREKETNFHGLQETLADEQQARLRLEEELRQARETRAELERRLENERLLRETSRQDVQTKEETIREQLQLLQQERELKSSLEERIRDLQIHVVEERNRRIATERELTEERITLQQDRENLEREREIYQQRIRDSERTVSESEHRLRELQSAVTAAQEALAEYRRLEPRDWIIRRDEVILSEKNLGVGAWGKVYEGTFRGCQVAVKQIHDLILSPHNRRLFEREMSIASRCRHPHLLQFIGATNDDGSPLFITELLDTDLRNVLTQRALHHEEVVCIALDVARGLNYLHLNKPFPIIHRDISSSNVLLWRRDDCWRAKLSDYGAANFMRQYMTSNPGARIYAAPESQTSQQSPKVDVYSFGLLLCEMCIRELPVPQQIQDQIGLVTNGVLRELIMRCVARAPEARPTMNDVIFVLTQQAESLRAEGLVTLNGRTATL